MKGDRTVTTKKLRIPTEDGGEDKIFAVQYDRSDDTFYVEVPGYLAYEAHEKTVKIKGATPAKTIEAVEELLERYRGTIIKKRKVIIYQLGYRDRQREYHLGSDRDRRGVGLQIDWYVCWEFRVQRSRKYHFDDQGGIQLGETDKGPSPIAGQWIVVSADSEWDCPWKVIDWTQHREDFFRALETGLAGLVERVVEFMRSPKKLGAQIDVRPSVQLLTGPKEKS